MSAWCALAHRRGPCRRRCFQERRGPDRRQRIVRHLVSDGTALNLVANTRMALNDYAYDANSNGNSALFTLAEGTFAFVAARWPILAT